MATKSDQPQMQDKYAKSAGVPLWKSVLAGGVAGVVGMFFSSILLSQNHLVFFSFISC